MAESDFSSRGFTSSCLYCLHWFSELPTKPTLVVFLVACFGALSCPQTLAQEIEVYAELEMKSGTNDGVLTVMAEIPDGHHSFSLTQPAGGPIRSTLELNGNGIELIGDFVAQQEPEKHTDEFVGPVEELRGMVSWVARVEVSPDAKLAELKTTIDLYAQICTDETQQCKAPTTYSGEIEFVGASDDLELPGAPKQIKLDQFFPYNSHVLLSGSVFTDDGAKNFKPGDIVTIKITAVPQQPYHVYAYQTRTQQGYTPTMISIKRPSGWKITGPTSSVEPTFEHDLPIHDAPVSWRFTVKIPKTVTPDQAVSLTGGIQLQTCNEKWCDRPCDCRFTVTIPMGTDSAAALKFESAPSGSVAKAVANGDLAEPIGDDYAVAKDSAPEGKVTGDSIFIEADTPEQIAAMAQLYDVDEPIHYIEFFEMAQHPIGPARSNPTKQSPRLLWLMLAFILGAILSLMVYMLFNRSIETKEDTKQDGDEPVYPRMRRIAFYTCLLFSICIAATVVLMIANTGPWTFNDRARQSAATQSPAGPITWAYWHPGKVVQQLNQNKIVWVNYTAAWDPLSKLNEARVASNNKLVQRMNEMNVSFVAVDFTSKKDINWQELGRTGSKTTPVNFIYPPNYPAEPAIKLEAIITVTDVDLVLDRMEAIVSKLNE